MRDLQQAFVATKKLSRPTLYRYRKQLVAQGKIQVQSVAGNPPYNVYSVPTQHYPVVRVLQQLDYSPYNLGIDLDNIPWEPAPSEMFTGGCMQKVMYSDPQTGGEMILLKSPVGASDRRHVHLQANQWTFGIEGECVSYTGTKWYIKNSLGFYPKGMPHGGDTVAKAALALAFWDGPRSYIFVENDYVGETQ
jgi:hypothetical protein